ncbi:three-Cys-motif partner protein TcmP [Nostoc sp. UHCC 0926]|uniref:three-Cys-motif partner protein TcmP n=1 Tax=Nostoc sp. UHCC 0926 TaxID=3025190 RepID=UPI002360A548|nr:three-Cys-motif partner protein TcmP [Nostoc sp. UHCC 0926]WDD30389.1 three-Cys-motif partner protein TcmP [Nostoc sp. UHCC 0926]
MSSKKKYNWSAEGNYIPDIPAYAKGKHLVLQEYIKNWIEVICGHCVFGPQKLTLIDGFCGGGIYRDGEQLWEGSAIRMIRMVEEGLKNVQHRKSWYNPDIKFIFIDNNIDHTACLELQLKRADFEHYLKSGKCQIITNNFLDELDNCLNEVRARRGYSFFFLDPFGLDIQPAIVREIISLGRSEVLLTHMLSGLVRILSRRQEDRYKKFFHEFEADEYYTDIADQKDFRNRQAYLRNQGLLLYRKEGNVKYAWTFAIMKNLKTVEYYLIHLSSSSTALEVMKRTLFKYNNLEYQYHYGVYGLGFRELEYFEQNLSIYNISQQNINDCIDDLAEQLMQLVYEEEDGITFAQLYEKTTQTNPATIPLYMQSLVQQRLEKDIKIIRQKKVTFSRYMKNDDLIIKSRDKPLWIPGLTNNYNKVKTTKEQEMQEKDNVHRERVVKPQTNTLWIPGLITDFNNND